MSYKKSKARDDFNSNVLTLLRLSKKASYISSGLDYEHQSLIYQAAVFRTCAAIEDYIKTLFEGIVYESKRNLIPTDKLPMNFLLSTILSEQKTIFESFLNNGDERKAIGKLKNIKEVYSIIEPNNSSHSKISANVILATNKYPSIKNIKKVYMRIGIEDIFTKLHFKSQKDITAQLKSFLDVREAISHQSPPTLTYIDIERHLKNMSSFVNFLDRITHSHFVLIGVKTCWPI
jgi:RecG-like helicase